MRTLKLIALIGFGALSAKAPANLAGYEIQRPSLPVISESRGDYCISAQDGGRSIENSQKTDLFSHKEEEELVHLAALPVILTGIAAAGLLSGCEVNVGSGGGGFCCSRPSAQEIEEAKREANELYPKDRSRRCEHIAAAEGASPQEREWMCRD